MIRQWFCLLGLMLPIAPGVWADILTLRDGSRVNGTFSGGGNGYVSFTGEGGRTRRFDVNQIGRIEFGATDRSIRDRDGRGDYFDNDSHSQYDRYQDRPDYRDRQPEGSSIGAKYQDMNKAGLSLGQPTSAEQNGEDGQGRFRVYQNGSVYWSSRTGVHEVHGGIRDEYLRVGAERSRLGYPTSDELPAPNRVDRVGHFEGGDIHWNAQTGASVEYTR